MPEGRIYGGQSSSQRPAPAAINPSGAVATQLRYSPPSNRVESQPRNAFDISSSAFSSHARISRIIARRCATIVSRSLGVARRMEYSTLPQLRVQIDLHSAERARHGAIRLRTVCDLLEFRVLDAGYAG